MKMRGLKDALVPIDVKLINYFNIKLFSQRNNKYQVSSPIFIGALIEDQAR